MGLLLKELSIRKPAAAITIRKMIELPLNFTAAGNIFRAINVIRNMDAAKGLFGRVIYFRKKQSYAAAVARYYLSMSTYQTAIIALTVENHLIPGVHSTIIYISSANKRCQTIYLTRTSLV
jgi:hypothetical protein